MPTTGSQCTDWCPCHAWHELVGQVHRGDGEHAMCRCGWTGPARREALDLDVFAIDVEHHLDQVAAEVEALDALAEAEQEFNEVEATAPCVPYLPQFASAFAQWAEAVRLNLHHAVMRYLELP